MFQLKQHFNGYTEIQSLAAFLFDSKITRETPISLSLVET